MFILFSVALAWFEIDDKRNQNVYVSGLPTDITVEEFVELMSKYGIVMETDEGVYNTGSIRTKCVLKVIFNHNL